MAVLFSKMIREVWAMEKNLRRMETVEILKTHKKEVKKISTTIRG